MTVLITLTTAGTDTGPFNLYSDVDGFVTPFATGVSRAALLAGYSATTVPNGTTTIRVMSTGTCTNYIDISVTTTTSTTTTGVPTTTTTTTGVPANNFFVVNSSTTSNIVDVTEAGSQFYTITVGSYPVGPVQTLEGVHAGLVTATIDVNINASVAGCLTLYINTIAQGQQNVPASGVYSFPMVSFSSTDIVEIELVDGSC